MALAQARAAATPFAKGYEQLDELVACLESPEARKMNHSERNERNPEYERDHQKQSLRIIQ